MASVPNSTSRGAAHLDPHAAPDSAARHAEGGTAGWHLPGCCASMMICAAACCPQRGGGAGWGDSAAPALLAVRDAGLDFPQRWPPDGTEQLRACDQAQNRCQRDRRPPLKAGPASHLGGGSCDARPFASFKPPSCLLCSLSAWGSCAALRTAVHSDQQRPDSSRNEA